MTPQELKNSILLLAVQGKLVEQRAEEGTAEELYKKIQAEKQKLTAEKKIKKEKPLPEITAEEIPFDIPDSWKWVRLGEVLFIARGGSPRPIKDFLTDREDGINWIKIGDTEKGSKYINLTKEKIIREGMVKSRFVKKGDFLLSNSMSFGRPYILNIDGCIHDGWLVLQNIGDFFQKDYLYYLLSSKMVFKQFCSRVAGAVVNNLNSDKVALTIVPIPPMEEQKRIVAKIEALLPQIDRYEKAWSKLEEFNKRFPDDMQKSILQYAVQGKLVEQRAEEGTAEELYKKIQAEKQKLIAEKKIKKEKTLPEITAEEIPFDIPESWKWVRLGEVVQLNPKNSIDDEMTTSFIPMKLIDDGYRNNCSYEIKKWGEIKKGFTHFADGDIGVAKITPCFQNRKSVIFRNLKNGYGAGTTEVSVLRILNKTLEASYILWFLKSDYFIKNGIKSFTGTAGQQRIHKDYLSNCVFPLPPLEEQKRIVTKIEELLPLCEKLKK